MSGTELDLVLNPGSPSKLQTISNYILNVLISRWSIPKTGANLISKADVQHQQL